MQKLNIIAKIIHFSTKNIWMWWHATHQSDSRWRTE